MTEGRSPHVPSASGWFVIWTESRAEKKVAERLRAVGVNLWLPTVTERRRWSDRWRDVVLPLFPGYLFARGDNTLVPRLLRTPGVLTVVKSGGRAAVLSDSFVTTLRHAIECSGVSPIPIHDPHVYAVDDEVVVREGPLSGLRGVVQQLRGGRQLIIWIQEIGRGVAFSISTALVEGGSASTSAYGGDVSKKP